MPSHRIARQVVRGSAQGDGGEGLGVDDGRCYGGVAGSADNVGGAA